MGEISELVSAHRTHPIVVGVGWCGGGKANKKWPYNNSWRVFYQEKANMDEDPTRLSSVTPELGLTGYLYKKTRNENWQRRFFKTQGFYLTYYKNRKMEKLLAALSLPQVGNIYAIDEKGGEGEGGTFALELNTRVYILKANDRETADVWVNTLLRLREQGVSATQPSPATVSNMNMERSPPKAVITDATWVKSQSGFCDCFKTSS